MNKKDTETILMKYFYKDSTGYRPLYTSDCPVWNNLFEELLGYPAHLHKEK